MERLSGYDTKDLKLVYRVLHAHLMEHTELMDSELFAELQTRLRAAARDEGVDTSVHAEWDAWLGNAAVSCSDRVASRRPLA
jgi:hypothetical protein